MAERLRESPFAMAKQEVASASGLHYSPQPDQVLEVVIGTNPGTLEGQVLNDQKQAIASAAVVLFAESLATRKSHAQTCFGFVDRQGWRNFRSKSPPGDYKVFQQHWEEQAKFSPQQSGFYFA